MKSKRLTGFSNCICNKCGAVAHSLNGSNHRRCGGTKDAPIKDKNKKNSIVSRGTWSI